MSTNSPEQQVPVAAGRHRARLESSREISNARYPGYELTFRLVGGPHDGHLVTENLWVVAGAKRTARRAMDRVMLFMRVLGAIEKINRDGQDYFSPVPGKRDFNDCVGAECVIDVEITAVRLRGGGEVATPKLTYLGVLELNEENLAGGYKFRPAKQPPDGAFVGMTCVSYTFKRSGRKAPLQLVAKITGINVRFVALADPEREEYYQREGREWTCQSDTVPLGLHSVAIGQPTALFELADKLNEMGAPEWLTQAVLGDEGWWDLIPRPFTRFEDI